MREARFPIAPRGRATSFTESELPTDFCLEMKNRFINAAGGAEKRQGMVQLGDTVSGVPNLTGMHALVKADDTEVLFTSGIGRIYRFDDPGYTLVYSGLDFSAPILSVQMDTKLIFYNSVDRDVYTEDGTIFKELNAIIERGDATGGTDTNSLEDSDIDNFVTDTSLAINDLIYNVTKDAYGIISAIATASAGHTAIGPGVASAIGVAVSAQETGDRYELIDLVELNIIPTDGEPDNVAVAADGSTVGQLKVSAVSDWTTTDLRTGDWIRNTTRTAAAQVTTVSGATIRHTGVSAQTVGDSVIFMKSAMPISKRRHVHFGRAYSVDSRDQRFIRISGPNNPEDMTTEAATIDSTSFKFGSIQPVGDVVLSMTSFQRFFVMAGRKNIYFFEGQDPIADTTAATTSFDIIGLFPQGAVSPDSIVSIGNDAVWVTPDGVQSVALSGDASTLGRANLSESIKVTLRDELRNAPEAQIRGWHYPRRSWFMMKVGSQLHVFNYTAYFGVDQLSRRQRGDLSTQAGSWSLFDGKLARQNDYLVRRNGDLVCCGTGGKVYTADSGTFNDDGETYTTEYKTGWLTGEEPRKSVKTKQGHYIEPVFDTGAAVNYTVVAEAGFGGESLDSVVIPASGGAAPIGLAIVGGASIGGTSIQSNKHSLRWRGEQVRLTWTTDDQLGPDTLSNFTLYISLWGRR